MTARALAALWCWLVLAAPALAHDPNLSGIRFNRDGRRVEVTVDTHRARLGKGDPVDLIRRRLRVRIDGLPLAPATARTAYAPQTDSVTWETQVESPGARIEVLGTLYPENPKARLSVVVVDRGIAVAGTIVGPDVPTWRLGAADPVAEAPGVLLLRWAREGIRHILLGWDHLAFLLALLLAGTALRPLLRTVTAFTLAHSVTLAVAALGFWRPPSAAVEPLIALSVAVAAGANLLPAGRRGADRGAGIAFAFGLLHGFGFAGALTEAGLRGGSAGWALAGFNVGVEIGQAAVLVCAAPLLAALAARSPQGHTALVRTLSGLLVAAGVVWTAQRLMAP